MKFVFKVWYRTEQDKKERGPFAMAKQFKLVKAKSEEDAERNFKQKFQDLHFECVDPSR